MTESTPRISAFYLQSFVGQTVRVLGKVVSLRGETATVDAGGSVLVLLNRVSTVWRVVCERGGRGVWGIGVGDGGGEGEKGGMGGMGDGG